MKCRSHYGWSEYHYIGARSLVTGYNEALNLAREILQWVISTILANLPK